MSFHFSASADAQLVADIAAADQLPDEAFAAFIEQIFTFLTAPQQAATMLARIETFAADYEIKAEMVKTTFRAWMLFFRAVQRASLSPKALFEDLIKLGFSKGKATFIGKQYKANLADLSRTLVGHTLMVNQLVDMEWKFGVTAGSSEIRQSGDTFLQLKLTLNRGAFTEDVFMELTLPQFYDFLREMETAKNNLEFLS